MADQNLYENNPKTWPQNTQFIKARFSNDKDEHYEMVFCVDQEDLPNILEVECSDYFFDACGDRIRSKGIKGDLFLDSVEEMA